MTIVAVCRSGRHRSAAVGNVVEGALSRTGHHAVQTHLYSLSWEACTCGRQRPECSLHSKRAAELLGEGLTHCELIIVGASNEQRNFLRPLEAMRPPVSARELGPEEMLRKTFIVTRAGSLAY